METVSLSLFRYRSLSARLWAFAQMGLARGELARTPGVGFHQLMGTGTGEGFTPTPNTSVYAVLAVWRSDRMARDRVGASRVLRRFRRRSDESWTVFLRPISSRGRWSGVEPFHPVPRLEIENAAPKRESPMIASLTRASIRTGRLLQFWRHEPQISARIGVDPNVKFKIGMGEAPWLRQVTFSIWPDAASMDRFARADGPHAEAIRAVRERRYFYEELYARFEVLDAWGAWDGKSPLAGSVPARRTEEQTV